MVLSSIKDKIFLPPFGSSPMPNCELHCTLPIQLTVSTMADLDHPPIRQNLADLPARRHRSELRLVWKPTRQYLKACFADRSLITWAGHPFAARDRSFSSRSLSVGLRCVLPRVRRPTTFMTSWLESGGESHLSMMLISFLTSGWSTFSVREALRTSVALSFWPTL